MVDPIAFAEAAKRKARCAATPEDELLLQTAAFEVTDAATNHTDGSQEES